ncbi:phosphatase [Cenarchaeum symbiosum A]|uniref:Phosphatase n=1 Tax=Cenarchaeum symbiosum (strain A) TaxID=414004 RepID=A0RZ74_CENSY|nr:phosphatase [Cenarchaeum symbiosum A]
MSLYATQDAWDELRSADSIIFDCDGVMVDVSESYDRAIDLSVRNMLERHAGIRDPPPITHEIIEGFKATGGFNDEVDLAYAAILTAAAADLTGEGRNGMFDKVIRNADRTGISSVEGYLEKIADLGPLREKLSYPDEQSPLRSTFDQLFYGKDLYRKVTGKKSEFTGRGLIENDRVILDGDLISYLRYRFGECMGIVTGRGLQSIRHPLGAMFDEFDVEHSFFLEDEPRSLAKPNPEALLRCMSGMNSTHCIYVGDSYEDLLMARDTSVSGSLATFCGVTGTSRDPGAKLDLFRGGGASIVIDSITSLPQVLNQARGGTPD